MEEDKWALSKGLLNHCLLLWNGRKRNQWDLIPYIDRTVMRCDGSMYLSLITVHMYMNGVVIIMHGDLLPGSFLLFTILMIVMFQVKKACQFNSGFLFFFKYVYMLCSFDCNQIVSILLL